MTAQPPPFSQPGPFKSPFAPGFVLNLVTTLVALGVLYGSMRKDTDAAMKAAEINATKTETANEQIINLRIEVGVLTAQLNGFVTKYNEDMNKYIREPHR